MILRIKLIVFLLFIVASSKAQYYNQAGFMEQSTKPVFFDKEFANQTFSVKNNFTGEIVFTRETSEAKKWEYSGTYVCMADLSSLSEEGEYTIQLGGKQTVIKIDNSIYKKLGESLLKSFYHARVSEDILEKHAGIYARPLGHPDDSIYIHASAATPERPEGSVISSPGGWYDAGDYNKYIVNSGITTFTMLHILDVFEEELAKVNVNIPESGNGVSDLLDESLTNLKWMLSMQDPNDGGVYHKLTSLTFGGMIKPHLDKKARYVVYKSTPAALDFAATFAKASRMLKSFELQFPGLSRQYKNAAEYAYKWAMKNPDITFLNPKDVKTGQYDDIHLNDEWFWASVELFLTTKDIQYLQKIDIKDQNFMVPEWRRVNMLACYSALEKDVPVHPRIKKERLKKELLKIADQKFKTYKESAFHIPIKKFPWGSNSEIANDGLLLLHAYKLTQDNKYLLVADACAGYLLGANPLNKCFISGFGINSPQNIHDRRCSSDGITAPIPGLLAGGPTNTVQNDCGPEKYASDLPALSYLDEECSFSTNEIAINWNSAACALFLGLDVLHKSLQNN